jgi:hypothetical protein
VKRLKRACVRVPLATWSRQDRAGDDICAQALWWRLVRAARAAIERVFDRADTLT